MSTPQPPTAIDEEIPMTDDPSTATGIDEQLVGTTIDGDLYRPAAEPVLMSTRVG